MIVWIGLGIIAAGIAVVAWWVEREDRRYREAYRRSYEAWLRRRREGRRA